MATEFALKPGGGGGGFFRKDNRRLIISFILAIGVDIGFIAWFGIMTSTQIHRETTPPTPITITIVKSPPKPKQKPKPKPKIKPKVITPIPSHVQMPNIQKLPVMPKLAAQAGAIVIPAVHSTLPAPPANSQYVPPSWYKSLREAINKQKTFPRNALLNGWTGSVEVSFIYLNGHATDVKIIKRSRHSAFNEEALKMVRQARLPPPPPGVPANQPLGPIHQTIQFSAASF
ncbi:MAG: energy transducer TonB [Gammaproteobacteria bacterium]